MLKLRHLTSTKQVDKTWLTSELFHLADNYRKLATRGQVLQGKALYCLFYEPSFLTRISFERAMELLGGKAYLTEDASQFFPVRTPNHIDNIISILASLHIDLVVLRSSDPGVVERAAAADVIPIVNAGALQDHPTQAMTDLYTMQRELGFLDGIHVMIIGRLEHRNVSALLVGLSMYKDVNVTLMPYSGQADPEVLKYCEEKGLKYSIAADINAVENADTVYLNSPRTVAHAQLLRSRNTMNLHIDKAFMSRLKPHCIVLDPMQRSGDFVVEVQDPRLAFYRQAENALFIRMAVLSLLLA